MSSYLPAIGAAILPNLGGFVGSLFLRDQIVKKDGTQAWYETLKRPSWRPPNWVFGPVWTTLYSTMGYASYLVWKDGGGFKGDAKLPLMLFGAQLALNWAWTPIFFGAHNLKWSLIDIVALHATVSMCGVLFYKINPTAGYMFIPYVAWLSLATCLNYVIWRDNPEGGPKIRELKD
ncbi:translocator protein [Arctopsyche grandis]|uniref:translocator protein n=1 Tax=Arctopsyche grandis TaxID=121162 RepID=UPI00406D9C6A